MAKQYTTTEAAKRLNISAARVRQLIISKTLKAEKVGQFNVINEEELKRFENLPRPTGRPLKEKEEK